MDENDPLEKLIRTFEARGYVGKEAVEEAETELERRREHEELKRRREHELKETGRTDSTFPLYASFYCLSDSFLWVVCMSHCIPNRY